MTGPVVPTPPAEVPAETVRQIAWLGAHMPTAAAERRIGDVVSRMVADAERAARVAALEEVWGRANDGPSSYDNETTDYGRGWAGGYTALIDRLRDAVAAARGDIPDLHPWGCRCDEQLDAAVARAEQAEAKVAAVEQILAHARKISPSPSMAIYCTDLDRALGRDAPVAHKHGQADEQETAR